jgi:hypothetical protein
MPHNATTYYGICGTYNGGGRGWILYNNATTGNLIMGFYGDTASVREGSSYLGQVVLIISIMNRDGQSVCYVNGTGGTAISTPAGSLAGNGIGIGCFAGANFKTRALMLFTSVWYGTGLNEIWTADTNALIKKVTAAFTGILPRSGGLPTFARNSAASWKDRNGRYWLASNGLPRAGDSTTNSESGIRLAAARTNSCYRNVNPADGSTWLLDTAGMETNLLTDGDMENAATTPWTAVAGTTISKETTNPHGGTYCLRVGNGVNKYCQQTVGWTAAGKTYHITGWARGDGTGGVPKVLDSSGAAIWTGTNSTDWQAINGTWTAVGVPYLANATAGTYSEFDDLFAEEAVQVVSDDAALTTAKCQVFGPNVFEFDNSAGSNDRYMRQGAAAGNTNKRSLSIIGDLVTGTGAQIGLWDTADSSFSNGTDITDTYVRTIADNITPTATEVFCVKIPAGCKARWIAQQGETEGNTTYSLSTSVIPNWSTSAAATRLVETYDPTDSPSDIQGSIECGVTPLNHNGIFAAKTAIVSRGTTPADILYNSTGDDWYMGDGTTVINGGTIVTNTRDKLRVKWSANGMSLLENDTSVDSDTYDASIGGSGTYRISPGGREYSIDSIKIFPTGK